MADESVVTVLRESEDTLLTLFNRVKASSAQEDAISGAVGETAAPGAKPPLNRQGTIHGAEAVDHLDEEQLNENRPFNQRINLPNAGEDLFEHELEENLGDVDEEELTRDRVKKASSQILVAQDRRNKKLQKKKRGASTAQ